MDTSILFERAGMVYRALNHPLRKKILEFVSEKEFPVTKIYDALNIEQSVCSQQLGILRQAGLVKTRRDGKQIFYSQNKEKIQGLIKISQQILFETPMEAAF